jgi:predicted nucleic acid-binding protein
LAEDERLGKTAGWVFESAERGMATVVVPTIVLAESIRVIEKKRLTLKLKDIFQQVEVGWNYATWPLDMRVVSRLPALSRLPELHDRIIVATAAVLGAVLITGDEVIRKAGYVQTVW